MQDKIEAECGASGPPNGWLCREPKGHDGRHVYRPSDDEIGKPLPVSPTTFTLKNCTILRSHGAGFGLFPENAAFSPKPEAEGDSGLVGELRAWIAKGFTVFADSEPDFALSRGLASRAAEMVVAQPWPHALASIDKVRADALPSARELPLAVKMAGAGAITEEIMRANANYDAACDCWDAMIRALSKQEK